MNRQIAMIREDTVEAVYRWLELSDEY